MSGDSVVFVTFYMALTTDTTNQLQITGLKKTIHLNFPPCFSFAGGLSGCGLILNEDPRN